MFIKLSAHFVAGPSHMISLLLAASGAPRDGYTSTVSLARRFLRFEGYAHSRVKDARNASQVCQRVSFITRRLEAADVLLRSL